MSVFTQSERELIIKTCYEKGTEEHLKTWQSVTDYLNMLLQRNYKDSKTYRNVWNDHLIIVEGHEIKRDIQKEKYKLSDIAREYRNDIRTQARIEVLTDRTVHAINTLPKIFLKPFKSIQSDTTALVNASDWHLGAKHENYWSRYSVDIAKERVAYYAHEIIRYAKGHNVSEILILNLGDMIEGFIHVSTRIQSELDAIDQSILAGELFSQFIMKIRNTLRVPVKVGWVLDNHSRIHPNKKEHIESESLQRIVMEFTKLRLEKTDIEFVGNYIDSNIGHYNLNGKNIVWVHGHLDNPNTVVAKLQSGLPFKIDDVIIAHRHSTLIKENVYQVPSMKGTDEYAKDKRLFGNAAQSFRIYDGNNKITFEIIFDQEGTCLENEKNSKEN